MITRRFALAALLSLAASCSMAQPATAPAPAAQTQPLDIVTAKGVVHFNVEVVDNDATRERGLMYRTSLAPKAGMLFDFKESREVAFWMKNTFIPLDMLFIDEHGVIQNIARQATPHDETPIPSAGPVLGVLEINGGAADALGIHAGDQVREAIFH